MNTPNWQKLLKSWHDEDPGMTPNLITRYVTNENCSSYEALIAMAPNLSGQTVLDLACGNGPLVERLLNHVGAHGKIFGVDMSVGELDEARQNIKDKRVKFFEAQAQNLPLENASVDFVFSHLALMLMNPIEPVLNEIARVLKPGGYLFAVTIPGHHKGKAKEFFKWYQEQVEKLSQDKPLPNIGDPAFQSYEGIQKLFCDHPNFKIPQQKEFTYQFQDSPEMLWKNLQSFYIPRILGSEKMKEFKPQALQKLRSYQDKNGIVTLPFGARQFSVCLAS